MPVSCPFTLEAMAMSFFVLFFQYLNSLSRQQCVFLLVPPVEHLSFTVLNDVCAESDTLRLRSRYCFKTVRHEYGWDQKGGTHCTYFTVSTVTVGINFKMYLLAI